MDPYDSDSSGLEDEGDYTDTGVLLGYPSEELIEDSISHLGGWPTWLDESTPPPGDFANCKVCNLPMHLLLELHGDLPDHFPNDERRLYIFGCCRKTCNRKQGSIRALRATRKVKLDQPKPKPEEKQEEKKEEPQPEASKPDLGASLFGATSLTGSVSGNANPFSSAPAPSSAQANPFATPSTGPSQPQPTVSKQPDPQPVNTLSETFADKVRISTPTIAPPETAGPPKPWPPQSAFPKPYPHLYLDAEYETLSRPSTPTIPDNVKIETMEDEAGPSSSSKAEKAELKDAFESELDKAFQRFSSRLAQNPEQVLRYEFHGSPLLYTHTDAVGKRLHDDHNTNPNAKITTAQPSGASKMPRCEYCGSERMFELQLVPHAISVLEEGREGVGLGPKDEPGMEWGTIILGVCASDCAPKDIGVTGWREEWAGVQWEEMK